MPLESPIAGLDFETSGYCRGHHFTAIEIGLCLLRPSGVMEILADSRLSGATKISYHAAKTHGIQLRDTYGKPRIEHLWPTLRPLTGKTIPICGHATGTEKKILREKFPLAEFLWIDTLTLSRKFFPSAPNHQLSTVCIHLGLAHKLRAYLPKGNWHGALFDAAASTLIVDEILKRNPRYRLDDLLSKK